MLIYASFVLLLVLATVNAHQNPSFPGQNANKPPEVHHQNQMHRQPDPAIHTDPSHSREFGGDEVKNVEHIKEHLDGKVDPTANMTSEQLQFHYFNMHDIDQNGLLDGIELIKAITHFHAENPDPNAKDKASPVLTELELERMLDPIFETDDVNWDGLISYPEFSKAQKEREEQARIRQQQQPQAHQQQQQR